MLPTVLRVIVRVALVVGVAASFGTGCSRQAEGERCDFAWAGPTQDCDDGLVCTQCGKLQDQSTDRCCRADGTYSDTRCIPTSTPSQTICNNHISGTGGTGTTGAGGESGNGATSNSTDSTGSTDSTDTADGG